MTKKIIYYFRGYLRIRVYGNAVERFINSCSHRGFLIWDLNASDSYYEMNILIKDYKKLKPVIRKTGTKVRIVNRTGFPFFIYRYRYRKLFFTGFLLCLILIIIFSGYIWKIDIRGNQIYTKENLHKFLYTIDISPGMKRKDVNCFKIVKELRKEYEDIIWVSASLEGTNLVIQIKENTDILDNNEYTTKLTTHEDAYDIVSSNDCKITRIVIRNGIAKVREGDRVKKGDLLISGQIPIYNDAKEITNYQYQVSDADIYGEFQIFYENEINKKYAKKKYQDIKKTEYSLTVRNYRFCFGNIKQNYNKFITKGKQLHFPGGILEKRTVLPYTTSEKYYTDEEIQKNLSNEFNYYCEELKKKGVVILQNDVKIYTWSDRAKAEGFITVEMPVGQLKKSKLIETGEHINGNDGNNN